MGNVLFSNISVIIHAISWRSIWLEETGEDRPSVTINLTGANRRTQSKCDSQFDWRKSENTI